MDKHQENSMLCGITPECITELKGNEIFIFGSNLGGYHGGGAARIALDKFGAIWGQGVGLQGQSYAIPTMQGGVETIKPYVDEFITFAKENPDKHFLVTRIGCGIAGFKDTEIASLFRDCLRMQNVSLPMSFIATITDDQDAIEEYGQVQTLCDIIKSLNDAHNYEAVDEIVKDLASIMDRYCRRGTISEQTRRHIYSNLRGDFFRDGKLDFAKLQNELLQWLLTNQGERRDGIETAMAKRDVAKVIGLVQYLNDFRRYTAIEDVVKDLCEHIFDGISSCGDFSESILNDKMFHNIPLGGHAYPLIAFLRSLNGLWKNVSTDGILDNEKLQTVMIDRYQTDKREIGMKKIIDKYYVPDSACHPEVFIPKYGEYYGPIIVDKHRMRQHYVESCGEGKGPNSVNDYYEFNLVKELIKSDPKYCSVSEGKWDFYLIPKDDFTLPVYGFMGKLYFESQEEKVSFIKEKLANC